MCVGIQHNIFPWSCTVTVRLCLNFQLRQYKSDLVIQIISQSVFTRGSVSGFQYLTGSPKFKPSHWLLYDSFLLVMQSLLQ